MIGDRLLGTYLQRVSRRHLSLQPFVSETGFPRADPARRYFLYLHIPFCVVLCPFCSFHRVRFREGQALSYFDALEREVAQAAEAGFRFSEVYFGGGTPTVLPEKLARLVRQLRDRYGVARVSAETNPDELSKGSLDLLVDAGINRLSVGVQSFDDRLLREMQRYEKYGSGEQIRSNLGRARGRFETLNIDMMFNFPHQTEASLQNDLNTLTDEVGADQVSFYPLMSAASTKQAMYKEIGRVDYGRERRLYRIIAGHMLARGYRRSSAWCFSRAPAMIDEYIAENEEYLGLGSGAFSYIHGNMFASTFSIETYLNRLQNGSTGIVRCSSLTPREQMRYYLLMRLFGGSLSLPAADARFGRSFHRALLPELTGLKLIGAVRRRGDDLILTESGQYLWVMMMRSFFVSVNDFRARMRQSAAAEGAWIDGPG